MTVYHFAWVCQLPVRALRRRILLCFSARGVAVRVFLSLFSERRPGSCAPPPPLSSVCKKVRLTSGSQQDTAHPSCGSPNIAGRFAL